MVINSTQSGSAGLSTVSAEVNVNDSLTLTDSDKRYDVGGVCPASPFVNTYDLTDNTLKDSFGSDVSFEQLEFIYLKNDSDNTITLGGGANDIVSLSDGLAVPAGGSLLLHGVFAITATSADQITVTGTAAGDAYKLIIFGGDASVEPEP